MDMTVFSKSLELGAVGMAVIFISMGALIVIVHYFIVVAKRFFPDKPD
jgi:Na+-transporting methylmalonyl-CoA/oxaloacetate decarboxylase gamma subunit